MTRREWMALGTGLLAAGLLAGCGAPAQSRQMNLAPLDALQLRGFMPEALRGQIALGPIAGGSETWRYWGSKVSSAALGEAVEDALRSVGVLAPLPTAARFELSAKLVALQQPDLKWQPQALISENRVLAVVEYTLKERAGGAVVYQRSMRSEHAAELGDALFSQSDRLRLANEGALRRSLAQLLRDFAELRP
jgi:hypothetical protein